MDNLTYLEIQNAINCGHYVCLTGCCEPEQLRLIKALMDRLSQRDMPTLSRMLCCRLPTTPGVTPVPTPGSGSGTGTGQGTDLRNCYQKLRDYACQHRAVLVALPGILTAATAVFPEITEFSVPLVLAIGDLEQDCDAKTPTDEGVIGKFVQLACYVNNGLRTIRDKVKNYTPDAIKPLVEAVDKYLVGVATLDFCCPAGSQPVKPEPPQLPWEEPPQLPPATSKTSCGIGVSPAFKYV